MTKEELKKILENDYNIFNLYDCLKTIDSYINDKKSLIKSYDNILNISIEYNNYYKCYCLYAKYKYYYSDNNYCIKTRIIFIGLQIMQNREFRIIADNKRSAWHLLKNFTIESLNKYIIFYLKLNKLNENNYYLEYRN